MFKNKLNFKNKKITRYFIFVFLIISFILSTIFINKYKEQTCISIIDKDSSETYKKIEYNNQQYSYNSDLKIICFIGIDSTGDIKEVEYGKAPKCETIALLVFDQINHNTKLLMINNNTIAQVQQYDVSGNKLGTINTSISNSYSAADGKRQSVINTLSSISNILGDIPIRDYFVINRDALLSLNSLVKTVDVIVPNNDLLFFDHNMVKGSNVTITSKNIDMFISYCADIENESGRMERQQSYIEGYIQSISYDLLNNGDELYKKMNNSLNKEIFTNISIKKYNNFLDVVKSSDINNIKSFSFSGNIEINDESVVYTINEDDYYAKLVKIFYKSSE